MSAGMKTTRLRARIAAAAGHKHTLTAGALYTGTCAVIAEVAHLSAFNFWSHMVAFWGFAALAIRAALRERRQATALELHANPIAESHASAEENK